MTESKNEEKDEKNEKKTSTRRSFLKDALITTWAVAGFLGTVKFNAQDGIKVGKSSVSGGMADAQAGGMCSSSSQCSGGGGMCSSSRSCSGS